MRMRYRFDFRGRGLDPDLRRKILRITQGRDYGEHGLVAAFFAGDPRIEEVRRILAEHQLLLVPGVWGRPLAQCDLKITRDYRPRDLIQHEYMEIKAWNQWLGIRFEPLGPLELSDLADEEINFDRRNVSISSVSNRIVVVRDKVKKLAEHQNLRHVLFRPTVLTDRFGRSPPTKTEERKQITWESIGEEPWWELTSDLRLPKVSQAHLELVDNDGSPYVYGVSKGCIANEGFFAYPELHYRESEIRALEPFDCALTYEPFGGNPREENLIRVISRRFYELLIRNFIRVRAVPVRLDPD